MQCIEMNLVSVQLNQQGIRNNVWLKLDLNMFQQGMSYISLNVVLEKILAHKHRKIYSLLRLLTSLLRIANKLSLTDQVHKYREHTIGNRWKNHC